MSNRSDNQINMMLNERKRRRWQFPLLLCLAILVAVGVAGIFHLPATAKTYQVTRLTCSAVPPTGEACADFFVHVHNDDCYDTHGNLVCPLPEIRPHRHTADCYTTTTELVCTIPESDGHQHTADCYTRVRGELTCELPTEAVLDEEGNVLEEGHVHTDECYAWYDELICGMEEGEGAHHHDDSCYETSTTQTCGMSEILLHTHTDDCYQKNEDGSVYVDENGNRWLVCGQLQVLEHVHGAECFTTYELDDGEPEFVTTEEAAQSEEEPAGQTEEEPTAEPTGESQFVFLYDDEKLGNETDAVTTDTAETENTDGAENPAETASTENTDNTDEENQEAVAEEAAAGDEAAAEDAASGEETTDTEATDNSTETAGTENTDNTDEEKQEAAAEEAASGDEAAAANENAPAAVEEPHTVVYTGTRGAEKNGMTVLTEIPEGALDENAQLILGDADEDAARRQILKAVNENAAEGAEREIASMLLTDIGFASAGEPAVLNGTDPIRVTLRAAAIRGMSAPKLFHLTDESAQEIKDVIFDTQAGTAVFTSTTFSPFAIVDLTGDDPAEETAEETVSVSMPAQSFTGETGGVIVSVEAPEGAFPAGTTMAVSQVEMDDDTLSNVTGAVESSGKQKVVTAQAVDISFFDAEQNLIEPLLPIKVSMKSALVSESENVALVHLPETGTTGGVVPEASSAEVVTDVQVVENPDENNEIQFESNAFSVYVLVGTETLTTQVITAEGDTYTIEVTYGPEAKIPAGAELNAREIVPGSDEFFEYYNKTIRELGLAPLRVIDEDSLQVEFVSVNEILPEVPQARYFDISIVSDGNVIEPEAPVEVKIIYNNELQVSDNNEIKSIHFVDEDEVDINSVSTQVKTNRTEISFKQDGFSVTGTIEASADGNTILPDEGNYTAEFAPLRAASGENNGPTTTKTVRDNGNGTHTIRLDILGEVEQQTDITKANVIVVLDISGSMNNSVGNSTRWAQAKAAVNNVASTLLGKNNPDGISGNDDDDIIEMALVTFSTNATTRVQSATSASTISSALNNTTPTGGTNWEAAIQQSAGVTFDNDGDPTYVMFISDGNPTYRNSWGGYNTYLPRSDNATWAQNWPGGSYYNYMRSDNYFYNSDGVYGLGGDSQFSGNQYVPNYSPTSMQRCYDQAKDDAAAVITSGRQFYGIGVYGNAAWVNNLVNDSGAPSGHYYNASDSATLATALSEIADAITSNLGFSNVSTSDGVTALSSITAKIVDGHATGFKYYKNGTTWADAPEATPTDDGITWDLSSENPLADQTTYSVEFDIWPSQEAYDTVANLNNGLVAYDDLPQATRDQINDNGDGTYSLKTNTSLTTTYTKDGVTDTDEWDKGNSVMSLDVKTFKVRKHWNNQLDGRLHQDVELIVTKDGQNYLDGEKIIKLTADADGNMISDDIFISCGFITHETTGYDVKEHGHDYSIKEPEEYSYYWDLTAATYRPMVIDGTAHMLVKTDSPNGTDGQDYYVIDGNTYQVRDTETILEATNNRRSWVNLNKAVTDNSADVADPEAFFEYTITVNNANAANGNADDTGSDYYIWFSVDSDPSSAFAPVAASDLEYSAAVTPEDGTNGYYYVASGTEFTISIKKDWNIRFMNLPAGSDYNFNETGMPSGFDINSVTPIVSSGTGATPATVSGTVADGDIDKPNTEYTVTYTNEWVTAPYVYIQKTDNEYAKTLSGAEFHMNKMVTSWTNVADYTLDQSTEITVGGETKTYDNLAPLGPIGVNRYQLIETKCPDGYIKAVNGFEFEVEQQSGVINIKLSDGATANLVKGTKTVDGKTYDVYILQLPNTPGVELPETGGSGTALFTAIGGIMTALAGAILTLKKRKA